MGDVDVVVALHACDTATDDALAAAVAGGATAILAAPCCHKELRPQLDRRLKDDDDPALSELLRHGVLADRHAEAVTDAMRCLALEAAGYASRVVEWAPLDHTAKNTMIVATLGGARDGDVVKARLAALATRHGVTRHKLCGLLGVDLPGAAAPRAAPKGRMPP